MIFKFIIVLLTLNAISAGKLGVRTPLPVQHQPEPVLKSAQIPIATTAHIPETQLSEIPNIGLRTPIASTPLEILQTIPEYLLTISRSTQFAPMPQNIPSHLLTMTGSAPITFTASQGIAQLSPLSPAQKGRSQPLLNQVISQTPVLPQAPIVPQTDSTLPRFDSNAYTGAQSLPTNTQLREDIGFSTPVKPLNFAPKLTEVQKQQQLSQTPTKPIAQSVETTNVEQRAEPVEQTIQTTDNDFESNQQSVEDSNQGLRSTQPLAQPVSQLKIDAVAEPLFQVRTDAVAQPVNSFQQMPVSEEMSPIMQTRLNRQSMGLSSYSF